MWQVNVDVDVPLFLPLYAQRRLHDLRRLAVRELREGFRIQGQMNFDSGWEWGYWLNDVVTARASWNPLLPTNRSQLLDSENFQATDDQWEAFLARYCPSSRNPSHKLCWQSAAVDQDRGPARTGPGSTAG